MTKRFCYWTKRLFYLLCFALRGNVASVILHQTLRYSWVDSNSTKKRGSLVKQKEVESVLHKHQLVEQRYNSFSAQFPTPGNSHRQLQVLLFGLWILLIQFLKFTFHYVVCVGCDCWYCDWYKQTWTQELPKYITVYQMQLQDFYHTAPDGLGLSEHAMVFLIPSYRQI